MSYDNRVVIERASNGYTVTMRDQKIVAANRKRDFSTKAVTPYQDPERTYVFNDVSAVTKFLTTTLPTALVDDDYSSSFDAAADAANNDED